MVGQARTVLVTGAAGGIGLAVCRRLRMDGWRVVAAVHPDEDAAELEQLGVAVILRANLLDEGSVDDLVDTLAGESRWDALVSNAGISIAGPLEVIPVALLRRQLEVNTVAPMRLVQALLPGLRATRGRLVFIGAGQGRVALPFGGPYGASKAALAALTDALRAELDGTGISVSLIEPGAVRTGILTRSRETAMEGLDAMAPAIAARYRGRVEAVFARSAKAFEHADNPDDLANVVAHALVTPRPKPRYLSGRDAWGLAVVALLPATLRARLVARVARVR